MGRQQSQQQAQKCQKCRLPTPPTLPHGNKATCDFSGACGHATSLCAAALEQHLASAHLKKAHCKRLLREHGMRGKVQANINANWNFETPNRNNPFYTKPVEHRGTICGKSLSTARSEVAASNCTSYHEQWCAADSRCRLCGMLQRCNSS